MLKRHPLIWTILVSLFIHLLLFLIFTSSKILIWSFKSKQQLAEINQANQMDPIVFEIVETVEESEPEPNQPHRLSDKMAHQQDMNQGKRIGEASNLTPHSQAVAYQAPSMSQSYTEQSLNQTMQEMEKIEEGYGQHQNQQEQHARDFSVNALLGRKSNPTQASAPQTSMHIANTQAKQSGMFQLNTYAWDFAPYLLQLKSKIERNLYPPPAFNRLGIQGSHLIQFTIYPDGSLADLRLIRQEGSTSLVETSRKAVQVSAPFMPLPKDFPEDKLVITARFNYILFANR